MTNENWTDEQCRYFFHLYADEKKKGNKSKAGMNQTAKEFITKKFEEKFGERHEWQTFKNKYDTCRRIYTRYKKLTSYTGITYDGTGRILMSEDWWKDRIAEWPGARKYKTKMVPNLDLYHSEFAALSVSGEEGWSAQEGEASLDSRVTAAEDEVNSVDMMDTSQPIETEIRAGSTEIRAGSTGSTEIRDGSTEFRAGSSKSKRKRHKEADPGIETHAARNAILAEKNALAKQMIEQKQLEKKYSVEHVVDILNGLPGVRKWSLFHAAAIDHLIANEANRRGFIAFSSEEDKISYLEHRTGTRLYD